MELSLYSTPIARRCIYISAPTSGGLLKPIWDAAFKPWRLSKELIANCNLIPLCQHVWELISDYKATFTTISHLQLGLCVILNKQFELLCQKCINLSRLLTFGHMAKPPNDKSIKRIADAPKHKRRANSKKKALKALDDQWETPIHGEILPKLEDLQLVPYTIEMMSLIDQSPILPKQTPLTGDTDTDSTDNYWSLLIKELSSINEDDKTTFIDSFTNLDDSAWSLTEQGDEITCHFDDLDAIFKDPLAGEKLTPIPCLNNTYYDAQYGNDFSIRPTDKYLKSQNREKNLLQYDRHVFTPKERKKKKLQLTKGQQTLFTTIESSDSITPLTRTLSKTSPSISLTATQNSDLNNKSVVIENALLKLLDDAITKQNILDEYRVEADESSYIDSEFIKVPDEAFLHDLNSSSTKKLLSSYKNCLGPGKKLDFNSISHNYKRTQVALMFYRTLLLANGGLVDLHQDYSDYTFNPIYVTLT